MQVFENIKRLGGFVTDLVFPVSCLVCGTEGSYLCQNCQAKLPRMEKQQCLVCQKPAPYGKTHPECVTRNSVDGAIAGLTHSHKFVQNIIRTFKYDFVSRLALPLSQILVETINDQGLENYFQNFIVVPVPLHKRRFNWRGFNQASLLSQTLADQLKVPIDEQLVVRQKYTEPQVRLSADQRKRNMDNAFKLIGDARDKKLLLVDDMVTSGSTANELAKLLKSAKTAEVWIASAAHG
jgi:competence protein ComFC